MSAIFGVDFHQAYQSRDYGFTLTPTQFMAQLVSSGDQTVRLGLEWWDCEPGAPTVAFNPNSASLSTSAFNAYIQARWPAASSGETSNAASYYAYFYQAYLSGIKVTANLGVIPPWAYASSGDPNSVYNPNLVGQFLADFVVYLSRQTSGVATLENIEGIQIFNEIDGIYGNPNLSQWDERPRISFNTYFDIVAGAMNDLDNALTSIGVPLSQAPKIVAPDLSGTALGGAYDVAFINALNSYTQATATADGLQTNNANIWTASGHLAIQEMDVHADGQKIQAWFDPTTTAATWFGNGDANMTFNRQVAPTLDFMQWRALVDRGNVANLVMYSSYGSGNPGDDYFDMNTQLGLERTMAELYQAGDTNVSVEITEFGASTYTGDGVLASASNGYTLPRITSFANPYEYGIVQQGQLLTQAQANNLQTVAIMETVGLIRTWSFVKEADVYEMFDEPSAAGDQADFGLAAGLNAQGTPNYKPAGLAYQAYLTGAQYDAASNVAGTGLNGLGAGFDVHIASSSGTLGTSNLNHNELVFLRGPADSYFSFAGGAGDLVVFADNYNTTLIGGNGYSQLYAGATGNDTLIGGAGFNELVSGGGNDVLTGGGTVGNEYVFAEYGTSGSGFSGQDEITNFNLATDTLTLTGAYSASVLTGTTATPLLQNVAGGLLITLANNGATVFLQNITEAQFVAALNGTANPYVIHGLNALTQANIVTTSASSQSLTEAASTNEAVNGANDTLKMATGAALTVNGSSNTINAASNDAINVTGLSDTVNLSGTSDAVVIGGNGANESLDDVVNLTNGGTVYEQDNSRVDFYGSSVTANIGTNETLGAFGSALTVNASGANDQVWIGGNGANTSLDDVVNFSTGGTIYESDTSRVDFYGSNVTANIGTNEILGAFGSSLTVNASGTNDQVWIGGNGANESLDNVVNLTNGGTVYEMTNSRADITGANVTATLGDNDVFGLYGANDTITLGSNDQVWLNSSVTSDKLVFSGNTGATKVTSFSTGDIIDLLGGTGGYSSAAAEYSSLTSDGKGGSLLSLGANGSIDIIGVAHSSLSAANFKIG